jgi:hypothetical protein
MGGRPTQPTMTAPPARPIRSSRARASRICWRAGGRSTGAQQYSCYTTCSVPAACSASYLPSIGTCNVLRKPYVLATERRPVCTRLRTFFSIGIPLALAMVCARASPGAHQSCIGRNIDRVCFVCLLVLSAHRVAEADRGFHLQLGRKRAGHRQLRIYYRQQPRYAPPRWPPPPPPSPRHAHTHTHTRTHARTRTRTHTRTHTPTPAHAHAQPTHTQLPSRRLWQRYRKSPGRARWRAPLWLLMLNVVVREGTLDCARHSQAARPAPVARSRNAQRTAPHCHRCDMQTCNMQRATLASNMQRATSSDASVQPACVTHRSACIGACWRTHCGYNSDARVLESAHMCPWLRGRLSCRAEASARAF